MMIYKYSLSFCMLLMSVLVMGQTTDLDGIPASFDRYRTTQLQEKLFVHTDRTSYLAGEIAWFKIYNVDASFHKPMGISSVAYVEILDRENKAVVQAKVKLQDGKGKGSLYLPVSLSSGGYRLRAYTRWMKNFSPEFYFEEPIHIINTLKEPEAVLVAKELQYDVQFFPEGGNLVDGLTSKVGFRATDHSGNGVNFNGVILDEDNTVIAEFKPAKFGIGNFSFTPLKGVKYHAVLNLPGGRVLKENLPERFDQGVVMALTDIQDKIRVTVKSSLGLGESMPVYLFVHSRNRVEYAGKGSIEAGLFTMEMGKDRLKDGVSHFTLFDVNGRPVCERLYFNDLPGNSLLLNASPDHQEYGMRKNVVVDISSATADSKPIATDLSIAVYRADSLQKDPSVNIVNYLLLGSELVSTIEQPDTYFSGSVAERAVALDNLMLTHGWSRFKWDSVFKPFAPVYAPELEYHVITGKVLTADTKAPAADIAVDFAIAGSRVQFYNGLSDANGMVNFYSKDLYGQHAVVLQTNSSSDSLYHVDLQSPFSDRFSSRSWPALRLPSNLNHTLLVNSINMQALNMYHKKELNQTNALNLDSVSFFGKPGEYYLLDNYVRFPTIDEVLKEYVLAVGVRHRNGKPVMQVYSGVQNEGFFEERPLVLFDGIPVVNTDKIFNYDPLKIRSIEVVAKKYFYGPEIYGGIIKFNTYKNNMDNLELDPHSVVLDYEGLQLEREFYSPKYDAGVHNRLPDFRSLLYWSPDVSTDIHGKGGISFYTSDRPGVYMGVIEGLGLNGIPGKKVFKFEVK
ncbi:hypothetical protein [Arcticibacter eurypsychrophilus]|uniref:hypothetical protein n=1 Tax=Arcticibacter eurypsychrophilus TaxID=1434752 RepID=UPI00084D1C82|nr:hypothetical protein [Arcticibacter eurypsychrophilus]